MWATEFVLNWPVFPLFFSLFLPPSLLPSLPSYLPLTLFFGLPSLAGFSDDWKILSRKKIYEKNTLNLK